MKLLYLILALSSTVKLVAGTIFLDVRDARQFNAPTISAKFDIPGTEISVGGLKKLVAEQFKTTPQHIKFMFAPNEGDSALLSLSFFVKQPKYYVQIIRENEAQNAVSDAP